MRTLALLFTLTTTFVVHAQNAAPSWLESSLYGGGKINTVVAVVAVIILGLAVWMFRMDRRLGKMEKEINK